MARPPARTEESRQAPAATAAAAPARDRLPGARTFAPSASARRPARFAVAMGLALAIHGAAVLTLLSVRTACGERAPVHGAAAIEIDTLPDPLSAAPDPAPAAVTATRAAAGEALAAAPPRRAGRAHRLPSPAGGPTPPAPARAAAPEGREAREQMPAATLAGASAPIASANTATVAFTPGGASSLVRNLGAGAMGRADDGNPSRLIGQGTASSMGVGDSMRGAPAQVLQVVDGESVYPPSPRALGIEGEVDAVLDIDAEGTVTAVQITRTAGHGFDEAARDALKKFRFRPARTRDGRPQASRLPWRFTFVLKD